jgi:hypothetical protein
MQIEITKEEYRNLLDVLDMADWMMHAHKTEQDPSTERLDRIIQKFYALARDLGQSRLITYDTATKEFHPTRDFDSETESRRFIDEFTDDSFWDELIHRLTDRDLARRLGGYEQLDKLAMNERFSLEGPVIEHYANEFDANGVDRLEIVEHFGAPHGTVTTSD